MMQTIRRLCLALLAATAFIGPAHAATITGSGKAATETRSVSSFQAISMRGDIDVIVRQGSSEGVQVRADNNILPLVQTVVEGSGDARTLRIQYRPGEAVRAKTPVVVNVDVVKLSALALSLSGSSDAKLRQLETEQFSIRIAGSGDVRASGRAAKLDISIAGSGDVQARELAAGDVSVSIAGSGDASVTAQKTLGVAIAGSGDVEYGGAATLAKSVVGSGTVRKRQP